MQNNVVIDYRDVSKKLGGKSIVTQVHLSVQRGEVVGIIGANGSGKTTLLRLATGLMYSDQGTITILGKGLYPGMLGNLPVSVGALIESPAFLPQFTGLQNLMMLASIRNKITKEKVKETIRRVGLDPENKKAVKAYSLGMRQRLGIAQAIMEQPNLLLLDEPTNGLDTEGVKMFSDILQEETAKGASVIMVSHIKEEIDQFCDRVYKIESGQLISIREKKQKMWKIVMKDLEEIQKLYGIISNMQMVNQGDGQPTVLCQGDWTDKKELSAFLQEHGIQTVDIEEKK